MMTLRLNLYCARLLKAFVTHTHKKKNQALLSKKRDDDDDDDGAFVLCG